MPVDGGHLMHSGLSRLWLSVQHPLSRAHIHDHKQCYGEIANMQRHVSDTSEIAMSRSKLRQRPRRITHRRTFVEYIVLLLIWGTIIGFVGYSGLHIHNVVSRRLALRAMIAEFDSRESTSKTMNSERRLSNAEPRLEELTTTEPMIANDGSASRKTIVDSTIGKESTESTTVAGGDNNANQKRDEASVTSPDANFISWVVPNVSVRMFSSDQDFRLRAHGAGRIVVLKFWATWCGPCIQELPTFADVAARYPNNDTVFIAVNTEETPTELRNFIDDLGVEVSVGTDESGSAAAAFGVAELPTTVLIDQQGIV